MEAGDREFESRSRQAHLFFNEIGDCFECFHLLCLASLHGCSDNSLYTLQILMNAA